MLLFSKESNREENAIYPIYMIHMYMYGNDNPFAFIYCLLKNGYYP